MLDVVAENSTYVLTVAFTDRNGNPATPSEATYRIDESTQEGGDDSEVLDDTAISPLASSVDISLTPANNAIIDPTRAFEERVVTVTATYGVNDVKVDEYRYRVRNLRFA
jgi:hypothetical protein